MLTAELKSLIGGNIHIELLHTLLLQANCFSLDNADICSFVHLKIMRIKLLECPFGSPRLRNIKNSIIEREDFPMCISFDSACNYKIKKVTVEWFL